MLSIETTTITMAVNELFGIFLVGQLSVIFLFALGAFSACLARYITLIIKRKKEEKEHV